MTTSNIKSVHSNNSTKILLLSFCLLIFLTEILLIGYVLFLRNKLVKVDDYQKKNEQRILKSWQLSRNKREFRYNRCRGYSVYVDCTIMQQCWSDLNETIGEQCRKVCQSIKGDKGDVGDRGPVGLMGVVGQSGPIGPKGEKGDCGQKGEQGLVGIKGDIGFVGSPGLKGIKGEPGIAGLIISSKGEKGDTGQKGEQGLVGMKGKKGEPGKGSSIFPDAQ